MAWRLSPKSVTSSIVYGATLIAGAAHGADLPARKAPELPPIFSWTGVYVGLNTGYLLKGNDSIDVATANLFDQARTGIGPASALGASGSAGGRLDGVMYGVQLGYSQEFANKFVAGFEADIQGGHAQGGSHFGSVITVPPALIPGLTSAVTEVKVSRALDYFGTVRGPPRLCRDAKPPRLCDGRSCLRESVDKRLGQADSRSRVTCIDGWRRRCGWRAHRVDGRRRARVGLLSERERENRISLL